MQRYSSGNPDAYEPGIGENDGRARLSRGVSSQSSADERAFLDGVVPPEDRGIREQDVVAPVKSFDGIAVVVGRRPGAPEARQQPAPPRPVQQKPLPPRPIRQKPMPARPVQQKPAPPRPISPKPAPQKPMRREPPPPQRSPAAHLPAVRAAAGGMPARKAPSSVVVQKHTRGAVFNPGDNRSFETAEADGFSAYLQRSFETQRRAGGRMLAVALIVGGGWAGLVPLSGAVVVPGTVVAESSVKKVQHQTGGIIAAIEVTDGMHVRKGDILVRLNDTQVRANYEQLRSRIAQLNEEIAGMEGQIKSKETQAGLTAQELEGVQKLWEQRLTPLTRLLSLQRDAARLEGEKKQLVSSIAEARGKIGEVEVQLVATRDQLAHIDLRAPVNGIVHELAVHTVGGVVTPAEVVMVIVPEGDELQIDAHLPPEQIDQVRKGQNALITFPAFNQRTTPQITGVVAQVSPDITRDQPNSPGYYTVRVALPGQELARIGDRQLIAGMPAELFIQTGSRTMMSYLFKPITEQLQRMFRER